MIVPNLSWIKTQSATDQAFVNSLRAEIDLGEAEAIALAVECSADRLLMDEKLGRTIALKLEIQVTGVLGILIAAKQNNLIQDVKPLLDNLIERVGFWVDEQLYREVLQAVNELN